LDASQGWLLGQEVEEGEPAGVMFRQLQELNADDRALIQAIIDQRRETQKKREKDSTQDGENENRPDDSG
jgi:hypothetical protein